MAPLSNEQVENIAHQIVGIMDNKPKPIPSPNVSLGRNGIFGTIDDAVKAAQNAQSQWISLKLEKRKRYYCCYQKKYVGSC